MDEHEARRRLPTPAAPLPPAHPTFDIGSMIPGAILGLLLLVRCVPRPWR